MLKGFCCTIFAVYKNVCGESLKSETEVNIHRVEKTELKSYCLGFWLVGQCVI